MATEMMPTLSPSLAIASKRCEPNRQSNWSRHLNQSKSIRLRRVTGTVFQWEPKVGASFNKCCRKQQQQQQATALDLDLGTQESDSHSHLNVPHQTHTAASFEMRAAQLGCGDLGRVSINHVGVDYDEDDDDQRSKQQATEATQAAANTSGIQNPMISSSVKSKSSSRPNSRQQQQEQEKHLKTTRIEREIATTKTTTTTSNRLTTSARGVRQRVLGVPLPMVAVMVASIVCGANLIGDCICDTNGGGNPFSGYRSAAAFAADNEYKEAAFSSGLPAANVAWRGPVTSSATIRRLSRAFKSEVQEGLQRQSRDPRIAARDDRRPTQASMAAATRKHHMDELLRSMAESIERQHADNLFISSASSTKIAKPSKFDSASQDDRRETSSPSITRHDEYLRDILASHERHPQQHQSKPTKSASSSGSSSGNHRSPTTSKADQELRQIMLMHEHAAPISSKTGKRNNMMMTDSDKSSSPEVSKQTSGKASKWVGAKLLSKLPKDLVSKANDLMSSVPDKVFSFAQQPQKLGILSAAAAKVAVSSQPSTSIATLTTTTTTTSSPFTPRANAKNYLMGPILGLGQMLMAQQQQPKPNLKPATVASRNPFSRHVVGPMMWAQSLQQQQSQPNYSQPANELRPATEPVSGSKSKKPSEQRRQETTSSEMLANAKLSNTPNSDNDDANKITSSSSSQLSSTNSKHQKITNGPRGNGGWLVDGATQLAQTYFKDSFRDLLTLSQLPIYSGGPVSTAPSDLEPGGKKWLANKQAAEQMRGNRTNAMEELLRYVYILGNVGVRRKRDPLKALGSGTPGPSYSSSSRPGVDRRRRPLLALLADNKPTITSLIKFHPPKSLAVSKLSSFLIPTNSDHIKSRGVMWDMATDPTLAVTMFHLLERASVALPLGFLLMPFVHMVRHPFGGLNLGRILPARASHRSVDLEELAKRLDMVDKILSRSMRSTHRDASFMG